MGKRILPYFIFSTVALFLSIVLASIFEFSLSNSWQAGIVLAFVFGPYWCFFWKKARLSSGSKCIFIRFCLVNILLGYIIAVVAFLAEGF